MNDTEIDLLDVATVEKAMADPEVSKLPLGSKEFNAAVEKFSTKTTVEPTEDEATAGDVTEEEESDESTDDDEETPKPRSKSARIKQLRQEKAELERRLQETQKVERVEEEAQPDPTREKPLLKDFNAYDDYIEALSEWKYEQKEAAKQAAEERKQQEAESTKRLSAWEEKEKSFKTTHKDYDEVVSVASVQDLKIGPGGKHYLNSETDHGPELIYKLLNDDDLAEKFAAASPVKQVAMLARLEAQIEDTSTPAKKTVTSLGDPPPKLPTGRTSNVSGADLIKDAAKMSFADWDKHFQKKTANYRR